MLALEAVMLLLAVPMAYAVCGLKECTLLNGTVPVPVYNSHYKILENGSLCCDTRTCDAGMKEVQAKCGPVRGIVYEPCVYCYTCAKLAW